MKFNCSGCGLCCLKIRDGIEYLRTVTSDPNLAFPHTWDETGKCSMLEGNRCKVYESRPLICNVEALAEYWEQDKAHFFKESEKSCQALMDKKGK